MATILLVGGDTALLEGLAQSLAAAGHRPRLAESISDAVEMAEADPPLVAVLDRRIIEQDVSALLLQLAQGGAMLLYHPTGATVEPLAPVHQRAILAELELPLERHRLLALVQRVDERVRATGRNRRLTPPESRAH